MTRSSLFVFAATLLCCCAVVVAILTAAETTIRLTKDIYGQISNDVRKSPATTSREKYEFSKKFMDFFLPDAPGSQELCHLAHATDKDYDELTDSHKKPLRRHGCVNIRVSRKNACCWQNVQDKDKQTLGLLPIYCCDEGRTMAESWKAGKCEEIISLVCEAHSPEPYGLDQDETEAMTMGGWRDL